MNSHSVYGKPVVCSLYPAKFESSSACPTSRADSSVKVWLIWAMGLGQPAAAGSSEQNSRAKKPRLSPRRCRCTRLSPASGRSVTAKRLMRWPHTPQTRPCRPGRDGGHRHRLSDCGTRPCCAPPTRPTPSATAPPAPRAHERFPAPASLMHLAIIIFIAGYARSISATGQFDDIFYGGCLMRVRAKIKGPGQLWLRPQLLRQRQITSQWLQHILPRADCLRVANQQRHTGLPGAHCIGNQAVCGPVAPFNQTCSFLLE